MLKSLHLTNAMFGIIYIQFWPGLYTRANTESKKDLGDKNRRVQEGQYFTGLSGLIFYSVNRANILWSRPRWLSWMPVQLEIRRLWVQPLLGRQHSLVGQYSNPRLGPVQQSSGQYDCLWPYDMKTFI